MGTDSLGDTRHRLQSYLKSKNGVTKLRVERKTSSVIEVFFYSQNSDIRRFSHLSIPFIPEAYC